LDLGGTDYDKIGIAGLGVAVAGKTLIEESESSTSNPTFAVQGIGAMGSAVVRYFNDMGGRLKSVSDIKYGGTWVFENGASNDFIQNPTFEKLQSEANKFSDSFDDVLYQDVDIIFPCALEDAITKDNAHKIKARFMAEGANNPTTDEAHDILFNNGTLVVPDILANPGGIIAAFVEMTSDVKNKAEEAVKMTQERVTNNTKEMLNLMKAHNARPNQVADYITYKNIFKDE